MRYKQLTKEVKIPSIGLGTYGFGGKKEIDHSNDKEEIVLIKKAIKLGYTHIDTAEGYGLGHTEELVGEAIKDMDRTKLFITTKVGKTKLKYETVISSCKKSLESLQTYYIDLYLVHSPNPDIPIKETMKAMDFLVERKMVKFIGVSNFSVGQLKEAQKHSKNKIVVNQIEYSLLTRNKGDYGNKNMELETIPYCQENDIIIMAERPVERGKLLKPHPLMDELEKKYNKTKAQIAINWLISKEKVITIPKSSNIEHLKENLGALDFEMSEKDLKRLDNLKY